LHLSEDVFVVRNGRVVHHWLESEPPTIFIASEKVGDRFLKTIVRGNLSLKGNPIRMARLPTEETFRVRLIDAKGYWHSGDAIPPCFEAVGVPPGRYQVVLEWVVNESDRFRGMYSQDRTPIHLTVGGDYEVQRFDLDLKEGPGMPRGFPR
jgi:hypothetical protein